MCLCKSCLSFALCPQLVHSVLLSSLNGWAVLSWASRASLLWTSRLHFSHLNSLWLFVVSAALISSGVDASRSICSFPYFNNFHYYHCNIAFHLWYCVASILAVIVFSTTVMSMLFSIFGIVSPSLFAVVFSIYVPVNSWGSFVPFYCEIFVF